jgi:hypothetical protein
MLDLSGVTVHTETLVRAPADVLWALVTDLSLTPSVNRETVETRWIPPADGPAEGAVFMATNELADHRWTVECHVTSCVAPVTFHWTVLAPTDASSSWWYDLEATGRCQTTVRHGFRHGPNMSGLRRRIEQDPDNRDAIIAARTGMLRANMAFTLEQFRQRAEATC